MKEKHKHFGKILFSVLLAVAFIVFAGIKPIYANILSTKQGINEYHFYNDTKENKDSAKEIQKQVITDQGKISDPGHVFKDKSKVLEKWQDEEGNDIKFDTPIEIKRNDKKIINVYPVFKKQVVITYYIPGSTNDRVYMTDTITDASSYKLPVDPTIYDANKYFVNWSETKDGKSGVYDEESLKKDIAAGKTDIKLYAITEFKHKATFITGDGASFQDQILADDGGKLDKMPEKPTRAGYEFSHWSLTEDGDPVDLNTLVLDKDINVYAVWKPVVVDYKFKVMVQNINDDGYTFHEIISARGLNGEKTSLPFKGSENPDPKVAPSGPIVEDIAKLTEKDGRFNDSYNSKDENGQMDHTYTNPQTLDYLGFHLNEEKTKQAFETIKADGSTVVPVYMDRNVHTIWVYKNASGTSYYQANWVNATDENGNIHVDLRYGQSSETWFDKLNKDYIYYKDKSIGSFYTKAPVMGDKDVYMYRVYAKGQGFQLRFVEWDPSKFNAQINSRSLDQLKATLGTMKEIGDRVKFENTEHYVTYYGRNYRVFEPSDGMWASKTNTWVDETDHVDDIKGFQPKTGDMSADGLQSVNVNNPAFRDYMFTPKGYGGYFNYTGTKYIDNGSYVGFLFYKRKTYNIIYYSGNKKLASNPYKYEADTSDFGLDYKIGETKNPDNPNQVFMGWYEDSSFSVEHKHEDGAKMPAHDITVYAKWDSRQYEVTFHTNQDDYEKDIEKITEIPEDDTLYDGKYKDAKVSEENFPQPVKPKDATEFLGWYEKNKNGRFVKANLHKPIKNNDTHLYAKWKYDYLELKYDLNLPATDKVEGKAPTDSNSYIKDAKAQATDVGNVKVNGGKKVFVGWSETKDGSSGLILPSETILMDKNKTLYAQWKEFPDLKTTKVTYDANGGVGDQYVVEEIITNDSHTVLGNGEGEKIKFTREGYVFKGWNTDKDATKAKFQKGNEVTVDSENEDTNNYIYAIWAPIINYTTDGNGQVKEGENFVDNTKEEVELKSNPKGTETKANDGYKFSHWTADKEITLKDGTKIPVGGEITEEQLKQAVITEPLTFTAHFVQDEFNVKHEFKVAEDSPVKEMPADVKTAVDAQLPEDKTAEDGKTTTPGELKDPTDVEDKTNDGVWKFEGFKDQDTTTDEVDAKVNGADVTFEGTWKFTPNEHKVTYEYVSGTEGKELPEALKAKAPDEVTGKVKGDTVTSPVPTGDEATFRDEANKGTWKFKSYDKDSVEITNKDENVKGTWEFTPDTEPGKYNVTHEFKVAEDSPVKEMPADVKKSVDAQLPEDKTAVNGTNATPGELKEPKDVEDKTNDGVWKFEGFKDQDPDTTDVDAKVNGADVTFEGAWKFTPNEHKVTYKFESEDSTKPLPKEVTALLPDPEKGKVKGDKVTPTKPIPEEITTQDGVWTFVGYDEESKTVGDKDVEFIGKWKFSPKPDPVTYNVNHQFKSATEGKDLPQAVKDQLPAQQTGKEDGSVVTPTAPTQTEIKDTENDGTWNFKGYKDLDTTTDDVDAKVDGADVMFEGSWEFTPNEHKVTYEYVSGTEGKELPEALKAKAPDEVTGKVKGETVTSPVPTGDDATFRDETNKGTWTFKSYDKNEVEITNKDENVKGTWEFTPDTEPGKYNVTHKFVSKDPNKELPQAVKDLTPAQQTGKKDGSTVTPTAPEQTTVKDTENDGTWTFEGFKDQNPDTKDVDAKVNGADVTFEGEWKFTPNKHNVTYEYESGTKGVELPAELKAKAPEKVTGKVKGEKVTSPVPTGKDAEYRDETNKGTWKFKSYDKDSVTISNQDETVTGTWEFTPDVVTEYVDEDGKTIAPKQDGTQPNKDIEGYEFVKTEKDDKGNTKHIYKKKTTPTPEVVTEFVDEDGKTIAPKENGTQPNKDIEGYEFVKTEKDDKGNTKHIYKKKTTPSPTVETRYVDTEGNQILADKAGTHDPSTIEGYQLVRTDKDENGNTIHVYKKIAPAPKVETRYVDENGNQLLPPKEGEQGSVAIDGYKYIRTSKDNDGNTIHTYSKTPFEGVETRYVDTEGNQILADKTGTHDPSTIEGYQLVRTDKDENGNTIHVYKKIAPAPKVETRYVDVNGNQLLLPKEGTQAQETIEGYEFVKTETDEKGNTKHIYKKKATTPTTDVVTEFVDQEGNTISPKENGKQPNKDIDGYEFVKTETDEKGNTKHIYKKKATTPTTDVVTEFVDQEGNTISPKENGKQPNKDIDGYEFVKTETDEKGNTKHIYKKKATTPTTDVVTEFVDQEGNTISPKENGKQPNKDIEGYEFVETKTDEKGNTKHIYKKKTTTPTTDVVTEFVDQEGNTISPKENGKQPNKDIEGYEFVETKTDEKGNTKHIYKKKTTTPTTDVVTEFVDQEGNTISPKENGKQPNKDIEGYEFVETKTDEKGNTKHIYKKVTPPTDVVTEYVDEDGKTIADKENGKKDKKDIPGYEFVETKTDEKGNTVHIYKKKTNTRLITQGNNTINSSSPNKKGTLVNTGDGVNASTYAIIMLAIGGVLTGIGIRKKKKEA